MTKFEKDRFSYHGGYLSYYVNADDIRPTFIARFKYSCSAVTMAKFKKQLIKNHTVEEYLKKLQIDHIAPLVILRQADMNWYNDLMAKHSEKLRKWF